MFKWLQNWVGQRNFNKAWKEAVEEKYDKGEITVEEYLDCVRAAHNPEAMRRARNQLKTGDGMLGGISDWDWEAIYNWFIEYFIPAMKVIIPIVIMLLDENPTPDDDE